MSDPTAPEAILEAHGVTAGYVRDLPVLHDVSVRVARQRVTVLIGPNGAGKSTLIKAVAGQVTVFAGTVTHEGTDLTRLRPDRLAAHGIAIVPQTDNVFRNLTVRQNLALASRGTGAAARLAAVFDRSPVLADKRHTKAGALSGGQRQVLAVAMALAKAPRLILMDEPSAGLSPKAAAEVLAMVRRLTAEGVSILLVEQNVKLALQMADHVYILAEGRNQVDGPAAALRGDRIVADIYLGGKRIAAA